MANRREQVNIKGVIYETNPVALWLSRSRLLTRKSGFHMMYNKAQRIDRFHAS